MGGGKLLGGHSRYFGREECEMWRSWKRERSCDCSIKINLESLTINKVCTINFTVNMHSHTS